MDTGTEKIDILEATLTLANQGVPFFPVRPNSKLPAVKKFSEVATTNPDTIRSWVKDGYNTGIATGYVRAMDLFLVGVDVDFKDGRNGFKTIEFLDMCGKEFPKTWTQRTATGGLHGLYWSHRPIRQGTDTIGKGVDTRGDGGYLVGPGSRIDGKIYEPDEPRPIEKAPEWLVVDLEKRDGEASEKRHLQVVSEVDITTATRRAIEYLQRLLAAVKGGRNQSGFQTACRLKDFGLPKDLVFDLMQSYWKCEPPLDSTELTSVVTSAFNYGRSPAGIDSPEAVFSKLDSEERLDPNVKLEKDPENPLEILNREYFFTVSGGTARVCRETTDHEGRFKLERMSVQSFHDKLAPFTIQYSQRHEAISKLWLKSKTRRSYDGIIFAPGAQPSSRFYNLYRGFSCPPLGKNETPTREAKCAVEAFFEHCLKNVCQGNEALNTWLLGFFAHLFQRPGEKPLVALVFRGKKGVGKNALIERVGHLLGDHSVVVSDRRYLLGNFNSILENKLLFTLDEAFWSGDKATEGVLKALVTGSKKVIERKGEEPYVVKSSERVVILGNEDWLVPASEDERRYAVFDVGPGRKQDQKFFVEMREGIEKHGGDRLLLRYFLDFDLSKVDVNVAPVTKGLLDQKAESLDFFEKWWLGCLREGRIIGSHTGDSWPLDISRSELKDSFIRAMKDENIRYKLPSAQKISATFKKVARRSWSANTVKRDGEMVFKIYDLQKLDEARKDWEAVYGEGWTWE